MRAYNTSDVSACQALFPSTDVFDWVSKLSLGMCDAVNLKPCSEVPRAMTSEGGSHKGRNNFDTVFSTLPLPQCTISIPRRK